MFLLLQILIAWLLADLFDGFVHWFEDRYMDSYSLNFLDTIAKDNDLHHRKPTAMLMNSGWVNIKSAVVVGWPVAATLWLLGFPLVIWLAAFFATFGNLVHRWAHTPKRQLPRWIKGMQEFGVFLSHHDHELHHKSMDRLISKYESGYKFCVMSDWLNPILDGTGFWKTLESLMLKLFGMRTTFDKLKMKEADDAKLAQDKIHNCPRGFRCRGLTCGSSRCARSDFADKQWRSASRNRSDFEHRQPENGSD